MDKMLEEEEKQSYLKYTNRGKIDSISKRLQTATSGLVFTQTAVLKESSLIIGTKE